jgi:hypothetical protein
MDIRYLRRLVDREAVKVASVQFELELFKAAHLNSRQPYCMKLNLLKRFCSISPRCVCSYYLSSITRVPATARTSSSTVTVVS